VFRSVTNLVGRPAMMITWDLDRDGLPTAVQFGAPSQREQLLLSLAPELEQVRHWPDRRPPV
jgi:Asp-tRNA(Asn)/Glu-tRNA(Gln) amidotransferase A subunit family amidase